MDRREKGTRAKRKKRAVFSFFVLLVYLFSPLFSSSMRTEAGETGLFATQSTRSHLAFYCYISTEMFIDDSFERIIRLSYKKEDVAALSEESLKNFFTGSSPEQSRFTILPANKQGLVTFEIVFKASDQEDLEAKTKKVLWDDLYSIRIEPEEGSAKEKISEAYDLRYLMGSNEERPTIRIDRKWIFPKGTEIKAEGGSPEAKILNDKDKAVLSLPGQQNLAAGIEVTTPLRIKKLSIFTTLRADGHVLRRVRYEVQPSDYEKLKLSLHSYLADDRFSCYEIRDREQKSDAVEIEYEDSQSEYFNLKNTQILKNNRSAFLFTPLNFFKKEFDFKEAWTAAEITDHPIGEIFYEIRANLPSKAEILDVSEMESAHFKGTMGRDFYQFSIKGEDFLKEKGNLILFPSLSFFMTDYVALAVPLVLLFVLLAATLTVVFLVRRRKLRSQAPMNPLFVFSRALQYEDPPIQKEAFVSTEGLSCWQLLTKEDKISHYTVPKNEQGKITHAEMEKAYHWIRDALKYPDVYRYLFFSFPKKEEEEAAYLDHLQVGVYDKSEIRAQYQLQMDVDGQNIALNFGKNFSLRMDKEIHRILRYVSEIGALPESCGKWKLLDTEEGDDDALSDLKQGRKATSLLDEFDDEEDELFPEGGRKNETEEDEESIYLEEEGEDHF